MSTALRFIDAVLFFVGLGAIGGLFFGVLIASTMWWTAKV